MIYHGEILQQEALKVATAFQRISPNCGRWAKTHLDGWHAVATALIGRIAKLPAVTKINFILLLIVLSPIVVLEIVFI